MLCAAGPMPVHAGTLTGKVQTASNGRTISNGTFTFTLTQAAVVSGTASIVTSPVNCFTDTLGNIVGLPNPQAAPSVSSAAGSGLPAGTYLVRSTWAAATGETMASPPATISTSGSGSLTVQVPLNPPAGATQWKIYIGTSTVAETLQATQGAPFSNYTTSSTALLAGAALPSANTSPCSLRFNDELQPSYTGYNVTLTTGSGATVPGFPQKWYLSGASGTINISSGTPLYHGSVVYPQAIVTAPAANGMQSISGPLSLNGFGLLNAGNASFSGPSPWIDITAAPYSARCDGITDDTAAIQAALNAANNNAHGGTVFVPSNIAGPCLFASPLIMDNFTNVSLVSGTRGSWPGLAASRVNLKYTGSASPGISARSCFGCTFDGIFLQASNSGLTGTLLSFAAVAGPNGQTSNSRFVNGGLNGPNSSNTVGILLSLDQAINFRIENVSFNNAKVAIQGAAGAGSFSNTVNIVGPVGFGLGGTCSISVADIQNPGTGWSITNSDFELGICSPGVQVIGMSGGFTGANSISFVANFVGDQTGANPVSTLFTIPASSSGWSFTGNLIAPLSTNSTIFSLGNAATGLLVGGNNFASGSIIGTFLALSTGNDVTVDSNAYGTITTFLSGTPAGGLIHDNSGKTTQYGNLVVAGNALVDNIQQRSPTNSFALVDNLGISHFFISSSAPYVNTFLSGNGAGTVLLGSANRVAISDAGAVTIGLGIGGVPITITQHKRISTGAIGATTRTEVLLTWGTTMGDTSYTVMCNAEDSSTAAGTQGLTLERIRTKSATQVGVVINNPTAGSITGTLDCTGHHD